VDKWGSAPVGPSPILRLAQRGRRTTTDLPVLASATRTRCLHLGAGGRNGVRRFLWAFRFPASDGGAGFVILWHGARPTSAIYQDAWWWAPLQRSERTPGLPDSPEARSRRDEIGGGGGAAVADHHESWYLPERVARSRIPPSRQISAWPLVDDGSGLRGPSRPRMHPAPRSRRDGLASEWALRVGLQRWDRYLPVARAAGCAARAGSEAGQASGATTADRGAARGLCTGPWIGCGPGGAIREAGPETRG
jgi:hypothetical protein